MQLKILPDNFWHGIGHQHEGERAILVLVDNHRLKVAVDSWLAELVDADGSKVGLLRLFTETVADCAFVKTSVFHDDLGEFQLVQLFLRCDNNTLISLDSFSVLEPIRKMLNLFGFRA